MMQCSIFTKVNKLNYLLRLILKCMQGAEGKNPYETLPNHVNTNGEQMAITASSMIRSHSVSGDLQGVQPDPIAADILRKEPEHETFARLKITPIEDKKCRNKSNI
ncbi:AMP deaminase-like [Lotus japonicus]|uniref:AMP deaminase-like n=1 Tax=Lotus japonicus TaxID=34305 RepID=UPI00258DA186|nr:AMP deaminase-like [Lotus japonicus]